MFPKNKGILPNIKMMTYFNIDSIISHELKDVAYSWAAFINL